MADHRLIRCTCNKILKWPQWDKKLASTTISVEGGSDKKVIDLLSEVSAIANKEVGEKLKLGLNSILDELGYRRYCCRRIFISNPISYLEDLELYR
ncbi:hypothetical protein OAG24_00090 [bacterium]|nr:hypothetical protein [bacterium]